MPELSDKDKSIDEATERMVNSIIHGEKQTPGGILLNYQRFLWLPFFDLEFLEYKDFIVNARRNDPRYIDHFSPDPPEVQKLMDKICREHHSGINRRAILLSDDNRKYPITDDPKGWTHSRALWFPPIDLQYPEHKDFVIETRRNDPEYRGPDLPDSQEVLELLDREYPDRLTYFDYYANHRFLKSFFAHSMPAPCILWDPEQDAGLEEHKDVIIKARSRGDYDKAQAIIDRVRSEKPASAEESSNPLRATLRNFTLS